jgi:UDPglucose 6-dehydrogenase
MKPQRVVVGANDPRATEIMRQLYAPFLRTRDRLLLMDVRSAEVTKYACNSMLATRISFMNEMAALCDKVGADVNHVRMGMAWDDRIGSRFLFPGVGYGGSCFPKDVKAIIATAQQEGMNLTLLEAVEAVNEEQKRFLGQKVLEHFGGSLEGKTVAFWGLSFKPQTDDVREAPAKTIADILLTAGAKLRLHDPIAGETFKELIPPSERVVYCNGGYDAVQDADALLLITEWKQYRSPDFRKIKALMREPVLFDGRNIWEPAYAREHGFKYYSIGRP